jgi:hypothetical protein
LVVRDSCDRNKTHLFWLLGIVMIGYKNQVVWLLEMVASWWGSRKNKDLIFWFITDPYSEIFVHLAYKDSAPRE